MPVSFRQRSTLKELLDEDTHSFEAIARNMQELEIINNFLGGHRVTWKCIQKIMKRKKNSNQPIHIAEVGCGGGDNLAYIAKKLERLHIPFLLTGIDINSHCIRYAQSKNGDESKMQWHVSDFRKIGWPEQQKPEIIFSALFTHHFSSEEILQMAEWMHHQSHWGWFVNDLHRHPIAYYAILWLTRLFSKSYLVRNDAPISVLRGFQKKELRTLYRRFSVEINWYWAFRYGITAVK